MTSHLLSLGVASDDIHRLLQLTTNLSAITPSSDDDDDDVTAMTSRLVEETRQLVLNISATPIAADHVTAIYRTAETGRQLAQLALNSTQLAVYNSLLLTN